MPDLSNGFEKFLNRLDLPLEIEQKIDQVKIIIEEELKNGIEEFSASLKGGGKSITPKFILQGSKVYETINCPCYMPPQQVDVDLGVHLPVSYHENNEEPVIAALEYFGLVDFILFKVSSKYGWSVDRSKQTCTRVIINEKIHIDVPLYSMPDEEFVRFNKSVESKRINKEGTIDNSRFDSQLDWEDFDFKRVLLCMRRGFWKPSDPRKMAHRFREEIRNQGDQLKRVWRYLKAWRDFIWRNGGGPSSVYLMIGALKTFKKCIYRDDLAFLSALKAFETASTMPVLTTEGEDLKKNQKDEELQLLQEKAIFFVSDLQRAINLPTNNGEAETIVASHLGQRFPIPRNILSNNPGKSKEDKLELIQRHNEKFPVGSPHFVNE